MENKRKRQLEPWERQLDVFRWEWDKKTIPVSTYHERLDMIEDFIRDLLIEIRTEAALDVANFIEAESGKTGRKEIIEYIKQKYLKD